MKEGTTLRGMLRYMAAVASVAIAVGIRFALDPLVADRQRFAFFYLALLVSAWLGGLGPGLVAYVLGFLAVDYFFLGSHVPLVPTEGGDVVASGSYLFVGGVILLLMHSMRRAEHRARSRGRASREREAEREAVMMNMEEGLYTVDPQGLLTFMNPAAERLLGWTNGELLGRRMHDAIHYLHPDGTPFPAEECPGFSVLSDGTPLMNCEDSFVRKDGSFLPVVYSSSRIVHDGKVDGLVVVFRDVTHQKVAAAEREKLLSAAENSAETLRRVQRIADAMLADLPLDELLHEVLVRIQQALRIDTAVILTRGLEEEEPDADGTLRVGATLGLDGGETGIGLRVPVGVGFCGRVTRERRAIVEDDVDPEQIALPLLREKGVRAHAGVPLLSGGRLLGVLQVGSLQPRQFTDDEVNLLQLAGDRVAFGIERTARRDAERRVRDSLEASNRAKDEFLAMLAHELRNPLSAVRNAVASASLDDARRPRALEIARRQADQLGRLIDDLLDVARITQGRITLRKERAHLDEIVERAVESTRPFIESRGVALTVVAGERSIRVEADPTRLEQVLVNLLSNAAKYTEAGGRVDLLTERHGGDAIIRVRDTGMGIAREMLPHVWELFTQSDRALDRAQGGLGIGLTVARRLVELHGGRIEARSEGRGKGAEFVVTLPALPAITEEERRVGPAEPVPQRTARVLLVEDNPDAAESLTILLELLGHHVRAVYDGIAALDAARASTPDVMVVDIGLPGMDGYEVARRVRRDPALTQVVLVALTGYGREEDKREAMAAGFDHHLVKPVNPDTLHSLVARLGKQKAEKTPTAAVHRA